MKDIKWIESILLKNDDFLSEKGYKGHDPQFFWHLYFAKRANEKPLFINKVIKKIEYHILMFFPFLIMPYAKKFGKPEEELIPYGLGVFIQSYIKMFDHFNNQLYLQKAEDIAQILEQTLIETRNGKGVSNAKNIKNIKKRFFKGIADDNTVYIPGGAEAVFGFLDLYDTTGNRHYFELAKSITDTFIYDFEHKIIDEKSIALDYSNIGDGTHILNANALAGAAMSRVMRVEHNDKYEKTIAKIYNYLVPYLKYKYIPYHGIEDKDINSRNWDICDVYHTGFTLRGMYEMAIQLNRNTDEIKTKTRAMFDLFLDHNENIKLYANRKSKVIDIHGVAEYIYMFTRFMHILNNKDQDKYREIVYRNIVAMTKKDLSSYYFQIIGNRKIDIYMPRWAQAPMMHALSSCLQQPDKFNNAK